MPTPELAIVHPLVLLSVVDHYNRVAKDTKKRVVGVLLGENSKGRIEITNSFAGTYRTPNSASCGPGSDGPQCLFSKMFRMLIMRPCSSL